RIICRDNVAIANISVFIFGKFFNSSSNFVDIPSLFWINNTPQFMPPGAYNGYIIATDVNNNTNSSYFTIIINNKNEKIPPIIIGPDFYTLGFNSSVKYIACDNSLMMGMWINENGEKIKESYSSSIIISFRDLSPGWHNLTVYAQDGYGNVGQKNVAIEVKTTANPKVKLSLSASKITPNTYPILSITLRNGNTGGYYNLTVSVDGNPYYTSWIPLQPYQIKTLYVKLPQMKCGEHVISVGEARVYVSVEEERTSLPIDMILKYTKNLKISGSKDVIYRGFEISEGNIILTFSSLLGITIILVFLGIYYSSVKGMKNRNIGVLRAIGASNRDIARLFWMDVLKYLIPSVIGGIILGYLITVTLNYLGILRAFGHQLIISPTPMFLLELLGISLLFVAISSFLILRNIIHTQVVHLMGREKNLKITKLEEVLQ
ncbi:MAG: ABC transporter permease, partial [Thermoplasmata archaeon]|nr:ABC transporter permease [Thermoplasmata archaeon]